MYHIPEKAVSAAASIIADREKTDGIWDPFYLYDTGLIRSQCRMFHSITYQPLKVHFATMANCHPSFLKIVQEEGLGVFVNSVGHLKAVEKAGFGSGDIVYTASAMNGKAMREAARLGAQVNLDSKKQIQAWKNICPDMPYGIRCDIGALVSPRHTRAGYFLGSGSRLGLLPEEIYEYRNDPQLAGLHLYGGTDIMEIDYFIECYRALAEVAEKIPGLKYLDLGGGFGIDDSEPDLLFNINEYAKRFDDFFNQLKNERGSELSLVLEPGRIIGGRAGWFICQVTDIKYRYGKRYIGVNASSAQFPRPLMYPETAVHPCGLLEQRGSILEDECYIYGCSTYSRDFLARSIRLSEVQEGDTLVFANAGSYCAGMHTRFLGFDPAEEIYI